MPGKRACPAPSSVLKCPPTRALSVQSKGERMLAAGIAPPWRRDGEMALPHQPSRRNVAKHQLESPPPPPFSLGFLFRGRKRMHRKGL